MGATPTQLAFALVCVGIGSILGMPFTGRLVDRYSSQTVSQVATALCLGGWAMLPLAGSVPVLALMLLITGLGTGIGDVAMNVQGHLVEQRRRQVLMPSAWTVLVRRGDLVPLDRALLAVAGCAVLLVAIARSDMSRERRLGAITGSGASPMTPLRRRVEKS